MSIDTALIFAAGTGSRWAGAGIPKQLFKVNGDPILHRTVKQLRKRGVKPIIVTANETLVEAAKTLDVEVFTPPARRWLVETIATSEPMWRGRMAGVFGDVAWTEEAMDTLCNAEGMRFLGRAHWSAITGGCPEMFGWTWTSPADDNRWKRALGIGLAHAMVRDPKGENYNYMIGAIWQPYRAFCDLPIDEHCLVDTKYWLPVDDYTDDVDTPESARRLATVWARHEVH